MEEKKELKVNPALLQFTYRKLIDYLQRDQNFTLENLNRSTLAKILDSNEKYLCMAVRKYSKEKTLKKLIEGMRMKYAASLLLEYMNSGGRDRTDVRHRIALYFLPGFSAAVSLYTGRVPAAVLSA